MEYVKPEPLDYGGQETPDGGLTKGQKTGLVVFSIICGIISLGLIAFVIVVMTSEWAFPIVYMLLIPAAFLGFLSVWAIFQAMRPNDAISRDKEENPN